jgi:hypothetical protein
MAQAGAAAAIDIEPDVISFDALDAQQNLAVTAADRFGNPTSSQGVAWSTSDAVVATVDAGVVTSIGNGSARIRAMLGTAIDSAAVAVQQVVRTATVDPASVQLTSQGATAQLLASGFDASGRAVPNAAWTWASSNSAAVSVTSLGGNGAQVEAQAASGAATITASSGTGVATADVTIAVAVDSVDIQQVPVITEGDTVRAQATPLDAAGNPLVNGVVSWATFPGTFAHVDASGLVTGLHPGTDTLIATSDGVSSSVPVTVDSAVITTVSVLLGGSVIPATDVFVYPGPSAIHSIWGLHPDLRAIAFNAAGMPMTERSGTWVTASALSLPVATGEVAIDEGIEPVRRRLRGVAAGQDEVVVEFAQRGGGVVTSDPVHVSIRPPPTVEIAPADSFSIAAGDSVLIQITPRDHLGEVIPAPAAWGFYFTQDEYEEPVSTSPFVSVACASSPCEGAVTLVVKGLESSGGEVLLGVFYGSTSTQIKVGWVRLYVN